MEETFKKLADKTLESPDTWEVSLSAGKDKKETWTRLITEGKLGYLALLRNLRNMEKAGVDESIVRKAISDRKGAQRVLPFRFIAASRAAPMYDEQLSTALLACIEDQPKLTGRTIVLVDVSGSMDYQLSSKSDLKRIDAAAALGSVINGDTRVFSFSNNIVEVPPRRGLAGVDVIIKSQPHSGTNLRQAIQHVNTFLHDRLIVITDEQANARVPDPVCEKAYVINVASYRNGIGYGKWTHIDGFSEQVLRYIHEYEEMT
jgi:60 kDa SS-A/Ro ribonucleoprotein